MSTTLPPFEAMMNISLWEDPVFAQAASRSLVWLLEHGVGFLPVREQPYDAEYYAKYQRYAASDMGAAITDARISFVLRYASPLFNLIDVGIGCGHFLDELRSHFPHAGGYDVNPSGVAWLFSRNAMRDPYSTPVEALTFWDALEHIPDVHRMIANARRWVFCSLPIVPGDGPPRTDWKHYRPDEHCWYFTRHGLIRWMRAQGFECVEHNTAESLLGREDIESFAFRRRP